jgi:two-component system chemotaxis response regulator CheY
VIADWHMPQMNGIELLQAMRQEERLKALPFLMVTAVATREEILAAWQAGIDDCLVKPFSLDSDRI